MIPRPTHALKDLYLQVLEFLEEMSEQLNGLANRELSVLKDLKVLDKALIDLSLSFY